MVSVGAGFSFFYFVRICVVAGRGLLFFLKVRLVFPGVWKVVVGRGCVCVLFFPSDHANVCPATVVFRGW